jgi:hypothetical protein
LDALRCIIDSVDLLETDPRVGILNCFPENLPRRRKNLKKIRSRDLVFNLQGSWHKRSSFLSIGY